MTARVPTCHPDRKHQGKGLCKSCYLRKWIADNPEKVTAQRLRNVRPAWLRRYSLTLETFAALVAQQSGLCKICQKLPANGVFHIDHDHRCCKDAKRSCGKCIRGLLCFACNRGLGAFLDCTVLLEAAQIYLKEWNAFRASISGSEKP